MCLGLSRLHPSEEPGVDLVLQLDHPFCSPGPLVAPIINSRLGEGGLRNSDKSTSCLLSHLGQAARSWGPTLCPLPSLLLGHEVRQGAQGASRVAPGKSGVYACDEEEPINALESW